MSNEPLRKQPDHHLNPLATTCHTSPSEAGDRCLIMVRDSCLPWNVGIVTKSPQIGWFSASPNGTYSGVEHHPGRQHQWFGHVARISMMASRTWEIVDPPRAPFGKFWTMVIQVNTDHFAVASPRLYKYGVAGHYEATPRRLLAFSRCSNQALRMPSF